MRTMQCNVDFGSNSVFAVGPRKATLSVEVWLSNTKIQFALHSKLTLSQIRRPGG